MSDSKASSEGAGTGLASVHAGLTRVLGDADRSTDEALKTILRLGCQRLGLDFGVLARVDGQVYEVRSLCAVSSSTLKVGQSLTLGQTYCEKTINEGRTFSVSHAAHTPLAAHPCYQSFGYESYIGTPVRVQGEVWGTVSFASRATLGRGFDPQDSDIVELLAAVMGAELERHALTTQKAAAQEEARHARRETQAVLDRLPAMVWRKDLAGNILQANEAAAKRAGLSPDEIVGKHLSELYPADLVTLIERGDEDLIASGTPKLGVVESWVGKHGKPHYVQTDKMPTTNLAGEVDGIVVVSTDITHLKRAEDELRSMNVRFSAFMRNSPAIKWAVDSDGCYVFINPAFEQMMAVKADQCVGRKPLDVLPAQAGRMLDSISRSMPTGSEVQTIHVELPIEGRVLPLMVTRFTYTDVKGETYIGGSAVDLSEVATVQRELAERNKDLKSLLYVISHDLREPLRAIRNFSGLVVEREYDGLQDSSKDMLNRVVRGAERLDQLLADVLTLSRAQRAEPATGKVPADGIIDEVLTDLQATIDRCAAQVDVQDGLPELEVDAFWLRQAVHNLVTNALKFTLPDESPLVTVRPFNDCPPTSDNEMPSSTSRTMVGLIIEDRGPGVEEHQRERIFGLFQRGVSRDVPGTGAGLAIVAEVAERYGGRVWVEDRDGGGARFILAF
ncbi:MAG: PAS domain-containing protein [Phycisphaeraceae bacterium]|nr:PAS domain-containing protein [Phycisphaeraceae bacterium]